MALFFEILWREFWTLLKLNMLFLVFCIPVVTIPASITAMSRITLTMMRDKNHFLFRDFFSCFKKEFLKSLGAGAIVFVIMALSAFGVWFYTSLEALGWLRMIPAAIGAGCFIIVSLMGNYIFAQIAYLEVPFGKMFKNAFYLVFVCIKRNLIVLVINAVLLGLGIGMLPYSLPAFVMIIFSLANSCSRCSMLIPQCKSIWRNRKRSQTSLSRQESLRAGRKSVTGSQKPAGKTKVEYTAAAHSTHWTAVC